MSSRRVLVTLPLLSAALSLASCDFFLTTSPAQAQSVTFQGLVTTAAGGKSFGSPCSGPASSIQLSYPSGSAVDAAGNLYIADTSNNRVCKVAPGGNVTIAAGGTTLACSGATDSVGDGCPGTGAVLSDPAELAVDTSGNLYIADAGNSRIRKLSAATQLVTTVAGTGATCTSPAPGCGDGGQATSALLNDPVGVALDAAGDIYIAGEQDYRVRKVNTAGIITTVAGTGVSGFSGDGGPATSAKLGTICSVSLDGSGNLYIADCDTNYRVRKVDGSGTITTVAGNGSYSSTGDGGPATSASLYPNSVVFDINGNMIIGDFAGQRVRKVNASGIITAIAGTGTTGYGGDNGPAPLATMHNPKGFSTDYKGKTYFADMMNHALRELQLYSVDYGLINVGSTSATYSLGFEFNSSVQVGSIAVLTQGAVGQDFQNSGGTCAAGSYSTSSTCTVNVTFAPLAPGVRSGAVVLYDNSAPANVLITLYIYGTGVGPAIGFGPGIINTIAGNGTQGGNGDGGVATSAQIGPEQVALDGAGNVFFADYNLNRVRVVCAVASGFCSGKTVGDVYTVAGNGAQGYSGDGGQAVSAGLTNPLGVAVDGAGNLYIGDTYSQRIRKVDASTHVITTVAGTGNGDYNGDNIVATSADLHQPAGVVVDSAGNLYISDPYNFRVRKVSGSTGILTTVAGNGTQCTPSTAACGDGGLATRGQLNDYNNSGGGIAVDGAGNLYIADTGDARVRRVDAATGIITTVAGTGTPVYGGSGNGGQATSAGLDMPTGVALDAAGDLYITDVYAIRKVDPTGVINAAVGTGSPCGGGTFSCGDGGPATSAQVNSPNTLAVDGFGNLYVADTGNYRIRKVDLSDPPTLAFPNTSIGATSPAEDVTFENIGNATLQFSHTIPNGPVALQGPDTTCITGEETLVTGASCIFGIQFAPLTSGSQSGTVVLTNNALNAAPGVQTIQVSGNGVAAATVATVTTTAITSITANTASGGGNVTADGGATVTAKGVCWGISTNPTTANTCTSDGTGTGVFTSSIAGLAASTQYHVRAYATNSVGTAYGADLAFTTAAAPLTATPTFSVAAGSYNSTQTVILADATSGAVFYYTTNGSTPTTSSAVYIAPIVVSATTTIKAIAIAPGYSSSAMASATYTMTLSCAAQPSGLVGWWQAEGNGNDSAGPDPVTLSPSGATYAPGMAGQAFSFDGASGYAEKTSPDSSLNVGSQSWTVSAWVQSSYTGANDQAIISRYVCGWGCTTENGAWYELSLTATGQADFTVRDSTASSNQIVASGTTNLRDGQFHLVTGVLDRNAAQVLIYADGALQGTADASSLGNIQDPGSPLEIGRLFRQVWANPTSYFNGLIDEVQVYNRALSASEVQSIYGSGSAGVCIPILSVSPASRSFTASVGGSAPASQSISITSSGSGGLNWTATKTQIWLSLDSTSGTAPSTINVSVNPTALAVGTYTDTVTVTAPGATGSPATVGITFTINPVVPSVTTTAVTAITQSTASSGGNVTSDGGASVNARGVCWSTSTNPTTANVCTNDGTGTGAFTSSITGLTASTQYHVRAYATNSAGTAYGADVAFTTAAPAVPQAVFNINPLNFPNTPVGTPATALPVTLSNPGNAPLTMSGITVTGANASSFAQTNNCGTSLAAGGTCTITVTFTPASAGSLSAAISVADNAAGSPQSAVLTGTGTQPQATLSPNPLAFPSTSVGTAATPLPMTLSNPGNAPLTISAIAVTGANANSFAQTNNCGPSLAVGTTCTITVTFTPASAGSLSAAISVTDNAAGSPQSAAITGTGSAATFVVNSATPSASVQPGATAQFNITVAPLGGSYNSMVTLSASGLPAGAQYSFVPASVMPGSAGAASVLSIQTSSGLARLTTPESHRQNPVPLLALLAGVPLLGLAGRLRRLRGLHGRSMLLCLAALAALPFVVISGCGGGYFGPRPQTYTVTVTGTSGSLQETTTIILTVQ